MFSPYNDDLVSSYNDTSMRVPFNSIHPIGVCCNGSTEDTGYGNGNKCIKGVHGELLCGFSP